MLIPVVLLFAFVAGVLTILAPCTLPIVPFVLGAGATDGGSVGARRRRTAGFALGFSGTFVATAVLLLVLIFGVVFVNNDLVIPVVSFADTKFLTRFVMLGVATIPASYWAFLYR